MEINGSDRGQGLEPRGRSRCICRADLASPADRFAEPDGCAGAEESADTRAVPNDVIFDADPRSEQVILVGNSPGVI
jgi:hypothetical protein